MHVNMDTPERIAPTHFIKTIIDDDLAAKKYEGRVHTRFPPEPNGYLHIGHAKSICLNFGLAAEYRGGLCNLRFDDTNPSKEDTEYVESIQEDVRWLGFDWGDRMYYASDYFEQIYRCAVELIKLEKAYVCDLTPDQMRESRVRSVNRASTARTVTVRPRKILICLSACGRENSPTARGRCGQKSTWAHRISTCGIR